MPPGQALGGIAGLGTQGVRLPQQGPQLVGPEAALARDVLLRQIAAEGGLVPGTAAIRPQQQRRPQAQQQGEAGTDKHGTLTHNSRRRADVPSMGFDP